MLDVKEIIHYILQVKRQHKWSFFKMIYLFYFSLKKKKNVQLISLQKQNQFKPHVKAEENFSFFLSISYFCFGRK
jgi:hypothetical protein